MERCVASRHPTVTDGPTVASHFEGRDPVVRRIYDQLTGVLRKIGPCREESKKTSIHIVAATALAGVATRKHHLVLTIKSDRRLTSPRIHRSERVSAKRFHHEVRLTSPADMDEELIGWLRDAYALSA